MRHLRVLDPNALTIGFARRFATYKRATLLFRDQERLKRLLHDPARPVQLIFSGKAHPADEPGKAFIQAVYQMSKQPDFAGKIIFVEDYDANIARHLVAGVDVWLNNPRRPLEASGTSGQKAGLNGVPNFSVLDGWWSEGYDGHNGWAIGAEREYPNDAAQDEADALSLYSTLEERDRAALLRAGCSRSARGLAGDDARLHIHRRARLQLRPDAQGVRERILSAGRASWAAGCMGRVRRRARAGCMGGSRAGRLGPGRVTATGPARGEMTVGKPLDVQATVQPGPLQPEDLAVELVYGPMTGRRLSLRPCPHAPVAARMAGCTYEAEFDTAESGTFAYGVRVRPHHASLPNPFVLGLVRWAFDACRQRRQRTP